MKLTRFPQSCFLIESTGTTILIDPGSLYYKPEFLNFWKKADAIFITHKHADHFNQEAIKELLELKKIPLYATKETALFYPEMKFKEISEGQKVKVGKILVEAVKMIHGYITTLKGEKEVNNGVGYYITAEKTVYHTGDTISFKNNLSCDVIILPYNNHGVCMGSFEAALFAKETNPSIVLPCHDDNEKMPADREKMKIELEKNNLKYKFLNHLEEIEF